MEMLRKKMWSDQRSIQVTDFGAGSKSSNANERMVKSIAKSASKRSKYAKVLFRIIEKNNFKNCIELGTSLGLSTGYIAKANSEAKVTTFEGCPEIAKIAKENMQFVDVKNVDIQMGSFDETLPKYLQNIKSNTHFDFIFIDGNHRKEPTLRYFEWLLEKATEDAIFVFDDIHWSREMHEAWRIIQKHPRVTVTIDIFEMGIVFLNPKYEKGNFVINY